VSTYRAWIKKTNTVDLQTGIAKFSNHYAGYMDLLADKSTVMKYLDNHSQWFRRCAKPLRADPIGTSGYAMGFDRVGAFGFYVDPRVGLNLLPCENDVYRICTIPIPDQEPQRYEVDFQAEMRLRERPLDLEEFPLMTCIEWDLDLIVTVEFPPFILLMSGEVIQKTGDTLLGFTVKQVSTSLTAKVQRDFHRTHNIKVPKHAPLRL
jgi:hypothetical protein